MKARVSDLMTPHALTVDPFQTVGGGPSPGRAVPPYPVPAEHERWPSPGRRGGRPGSSLGPEPTEQPIGLARDLMHQNRFSALPVVDPDGAPVGIVTATDLRQDLDPGTPLGEVMSGPVACVPLYEGAEIAARMMRQRRIHHLVVTHERRVIGILSTFDLLELVAEHRWAPKQGSTPSLRQGRKRKKAARLARTIHDPERSEGVNGAGQALRSSARGPSED